MENVSKALIIAGEVLIAVLVLSLTMVVIIKFGKFSANTNKRLSEDELNNFNNKFYAFNGRINITADEIASLINYAKENNDSYDIGLTNKQKAEYYVDVKILDDGNYNGSFFDLLSKKNGDDISKADFKDAINDFLKANNNNLFYCNADVKNVNRNVNRNIIKVEVKDDNNIKKNELGRVNEIKFRLTNKNNLGKIPNDYNVAHKEEYIIEY